LINTSPKVKFYIIEEEKIKVHYGKEGDLFKDILKELKYKFNQFLMADGKRINKNETLKKRHNNKNFTLNTPMIGGSGEREEELLNLQLFEKGWPKLMDEKCFNAELIIRFPGIDHMEIRKFC
jgi:hypothetical protein